MFPGSGGGAGSFMVPGGGINEVLNQIGGLLSNTQNQMENTLAAMNTTGGMLDPIQMAQVQMITQSYLAAVQTFTSVIKQVGDLDKSIANNIGS